MTDGSNIQPAVVLEIASVGTATAADAIIVEMKMMNKLNYIEVYRK